MRALKLCVAVLLAFVLAVPAVIAAKDTDKVGKITSVSGTVEVKKSGGSKKFKAFNGMAIAQGDTIITGKKSKATMDLDSDKEVTIGASTTLTISQLVKSASAMGGKTKLTLKDGDVVIKVKKKLEGDSRFEIQTPTAIMGVMGTEFAVSANGQQTYLGVLEGIVRLTDNNGDEYQVKPDEQLFADAGGAGDIEALQLDDLPLVALELYLEALQNNNGDAALINRVKDLIEKKLAEAESEEGASSPIERQTIIYADENAGGGSAPQPTPTATPAPTPEPTPDPAPPVLDQNAFFNDKYAYLVDNRTVVVPFNVPIAFADEEAVQNNIDDYIALWIKTVPFDDCGGHEGCYPPEDYIERANVSGVTIEGNKLVIKLGGEARWDEETNTYYPGLIYFDKLINVTINGGVFMNAGSSAVQESEQTLMNWALFVPQATPDRIVCTYLNCSHGVELALKTLGNEVMGVDLIYDYEMVEYPSEWMTDEDYTIEMLGNGDAVIKIRPEFMGTIPPGAHRLFIWFEPGGSFELELTVLPNTNA